MWPFLTETNREVGPGVPDLAAHEAARSRLGLEALPCAFAEACEVVSDGFEAPAGWNGICRGSERLSSL